MYWVSLFRSPLRGLDASVKFDSTGVSPATPVHCMVMLRSNFSGSGSIEMPKTRKRLKASAVPYARGFRPPTTQQKSRAVSSRRDEKVEKAFQNGGVFFSPIPQPSSIDDWLAQYNEEGQSYSKFLGECPWLSSRKVKYCRMTFRSAGDTLPKKYPEGKIYLLPLGGFDEDAHAPEFSHLADYASRFFEQRVEILPAVELRVDRTQEKVFWVEPSEVRGHLNGVESEVKGEPKRRRSSRTLMHSLEARFHRTSGNYQLHGGSVLNRIKQKMPTDAICLMALTMSDIYDTPPDLFVAGLAAGNHRVGVFSLKRYDPTLTFSLEDWHQITENSSEVPSQHNNTIKKTVLQRSCKLLVHEVSHLLGVDHCIWYSCCMNGSGHLQEDFRQSMHLCPVDLRKLQHLCGFDVVKRYQKLAAFFKTHGLAEEEKWVKGRLFHITESETPPVPDHAH